MNTVVILVVLLVVLLILLVLVSRSGDKYMEVGEEKIETSSSVTICGIKCFKCCPGQYMSCDSNSPSDPPELYLNIGQNCGCFADGTGCS